jgi:hypothetical protein
MKTNIQIYNGRTHAGFLNRILPLRELMQKHSEIQTKPRRFEKAKQLPFNSVGLKQVMRFLPNDEQMTTKRDENGDDSVSLSTFSLFSVNA